MIATTPAIEAAEAAGLVHRIVRIDPPARSLIEAAEREGLPAARKIKTLVVRRAEDDCLFVLIAGPRVMDWPLLREHLGVARLSMSDPREARRITGYEPGAITPFGSRRSLPVVADTRVDVDEVVSIGGGARGLAIHLGGRALIAALNADVAEVTRPA